MTPQAQGYAGNYDMAQKEGLNQKELEIRAFINMASALNKIKENWETEKQNLSDVLDKNRLLWTVIASAMQEQDCPQPADIRKNILQLATFVFKRTLDLLGKPSPEGLNVLININMNIARGLNGNAAD
ncbi:MAG: flagellar biosynthesis regulator FlaF [Alphaproteobacteria bacterium]|nr:flagellar biosynthesis regulator FlaF [Alphaproteobacteria bacterium]